MAPWQLVASRKEQAAAQRRITYAENQANQLHSKGSGGKGGGGKAKGNGKGARAAIDWNLAKGDIYYQAMHDFYAMDKGSAKGARGKGAGGDGKGFRPPSPVGSEDIAWVCKVKGCGTVHNNPTCQWCRLCGQPKPIPKGVKDKEAKQIVVKEESFVAPPTTQSARQRGKGFSKDKAIATANEGDSVESDITLTKAEKKKARAEMLTQTIIDMANTDPTVYLTDKLANCGETKCDMAKSSTLQNDLDQMILAGTFTENVIDAQRKEIIEAKQREIKAAKHAMTNWKLPQQANQRLLRLQADIEGKHTKAVEEHKKLEDDTTAAIKALREKLDQANVVKDLEDKVYTEKIDKVKCALDLLPTAYGKQKLIEEQMQDDQDMADLDFQEESDQDSQEQSSQDVVSASKVKFILDEALKQANLQAAGNADLQQGLAALIGGIGNALIAATSGGPNVRKAPKKVIYKAKITKIPVVPVDSDSDLDSDAEGPGAPSKRRREKEAAESGEDIYPWDMDEDGEQAIP